MICFENDESLSYWNDQRDFGVVFASFPCIDTEQKYIDDNIL